MKKDKIPTRNLAAKTIQISRVRDDLLASLNDRLAEILTGTVEEKWNTFKSIVYTVTKERFGIALRNQETGSTGKGLSWKSLLTTRIRTGITYSARTANLQRPYIEHTVNFSYSDAENSKINDGCQKQLNSRYFQTLITPKFCTKAFELCEGQE